MDVNEQIVIAWFDECKNMFTRNNIDYGQFHCDIDILAVDIRTKEVWDCEVKVRTGSTQISNNHNKQNGFNHFVNTFYDIAREKKINEILPKDFTLKKKFITTKSLFGKDENQKKWINNFSEKGIDVIFFDTIINEINESTLDLKKSTNEIIQTLRLLNLYKNSSDEK